MRSKNKKWNKKAETTVSDIVMGGLVFAFLSISAISLLGIASVNSVDFISGEDIGALNNSLGDIYQLKAQVNQSTGSFLNSKGATLTDLYSSAWTFLRGLPTTFKMIFSVIFGLGNYFFIPSYIIGIIVSMILGVILFNILSAVFQRRI